MIDMRPGTVVVDLFLMLLFLYILLLQARIGMLGCGHGTPEIS